MRNFFQENKYLKNLTNKKPDRSICLEKERIWNWFRKIWSHASLYLNYNPSRLDQKKIVSIVSVSPLHADNVFQY